MPGQQGAGTTDMHGQSGAGDMHGQQGMMSGNSMMTMMHGMSDMGTTMHESMKNMQGMMNDPKIMDNPDMKKHIDDAQKHMSGMMGEPHHVLAMAYRDALGTFAKALKTQATGSGPLDAKLAREAVAEIDRSFDRMEEHHEAHVKAMKMTDEMRSQMAPMMKDMDTHRSMMEAAVDALEKDVKADQPDAKQVAAHSGDILKHLADMAKMHDGK